MKLFILDLEIKCDLSKDGLKYVNFSVTRSKQIPSQLESGPICGEFDLLIASLSRESYL
jgi:hypothetical protein